MTAPTLAGTRELVRVETVRLLVQRVRAGLWLTLTFTLLFGVADLRFDGAQILPLYGLKVVQLANVLGGFLAIRRWPTQRCATWTAFITLAFISVLSAVAAIVVGDTVISVMVITFVAVLAALIVPWGPRPQLLAVIVAGLSVAANEIVLSGVGSLVSYPTVVVVAALLASVYLTYLFEQQRQFLAERDVRRHEAERALQEEARISAAMARVGRELIAALDRPGLIDRLCELGTQALDCDGSYTQLWHPGRGVYVTTGRFGYRPEEWEAIGVIELPRSLVPQFLTRMKFGDACQTAIPPRAEAAPVAVAPEEVPSALTGLAREYGITRFLYVPIARGGEVIGFLAAIYRGRTDPFTAEQVRIARGIGHLASLAIEHVQLVEALERAHRVKSEFVATMSHELRSPLNVIMGYNDLLAEGLCGPLNDEQLDTVRRVDRSAQELLELIDATLDLSRLEAGRTPMNVQSVHVPSLLEEIEAEIHQLERSPHVEVMWQPAPDFTHLQTDPLKLKAVLKNLIVNATKFTDRGSITVSSMRARDAVEFHVRDTGIGIPTEALPIIFEPFRQVDGSPTRRHRGVGLGLHIVKRLVDFLGGSISVESEVGNGSTFCVRLPVPADIPETAHRPAGPDRRAHGGQPLNRAS